MCVNLGDLGMEVLHVVAKHLTKLAEHFFVPGIILQVHLGLDLYVKDRYKHLMRMNKKPIDIQKYTYTNIQDGAAKDVTNRT